jgi:serine/threonine-protein kinase
MVDRESAGECASPIPRTQAFASGPPRESRVTPGGSPSDLGSGSGFPVAFDGMPQPGQVLFDRYLVERKLGEGGMGTVWLVRHLDLDAERALKLIVSGIARDPQARARFKREARILDRLNHPNAVRVYDARMGVDVAFIEMEYVRGESLKQLLAPGRPMPLGWVAGLLDQLCDVLQAANDEGIIHRDLKPPNMMVVEGRRPGTKVLKLLDFGIAKFREGMDDVHTLTGSIIGTPLYASPEQISGAHVDARSDLYSVGVILYELLTGYRPFSGPNHAALVYQHSLAPPPPFSDRNPSVKVPDEVERVVLKCLAKSPDDRPQSPRELAELFHRALASAPAPVSGLSGPGGSAPQSTLTDGVLPGPGVDTPTEAIWPWEGRPKPPFSRDHEIPTEPFSVPERRETAPRRRRPSVFPWSSRWAWLVLAGIPVVILLFALAAGLLRLPGRGSTPQPAPVLSADELRRIAKQVELWKRLGFEVVGAGGTTREWPNTLLETRGGAHFQRTPGGIYLPEGYTPSKELDPLDRYPRTLTRDADKTTFLRIAGGTFTMGSLADAGIHPDDPSSPAHPVKLTGYYIKATEVTNGEFDHFLGEMRLPELCPGWKSKFERLKILLGMEEQQALRHPALGVPWKLAMVYAQSRGGRLPTEAQWEFAARSRGEPLLHVWDYRGKEVPKLQLAKLANINNLGDSENPWGTAPVGSYPYDVTIQGVCDLAGNVREMCRDAWRPYEPSPRPIVDPQSEPDPEGQDAVVRGGSFQTDPDFGLTTHREQSDQRNKKEAVDIGFRIVIECPEGPPDTR